MKAILLLHVLMSSLVCGLWAGGDCSTSADACKPQIQKLTPFMAALKKAENSPALKQGAIRETALKQGESGTRLVAASTAPAAVKVIDEKPAETALAEPPVRKEALVKPAWLIVVAVLLAGLYYFLREGKRKKKRK